MDGEIAESNERGEHDKKNDGVDRTSHTFKPLNRFVRASFNSQIRHRSPLLCLLRADSLTSQKIPSGAFVESGSSGAAFAIAPDRAQKSTGRTVTSARPVLSGRRFSCAL